MEDLLIYALFTYRFLLNSHYPCTCNDKCLQAEDMNLDNCIKAMEKLLEKTLEFKNIKRDIDDMYA